jgi:hypothetical protein
MGKILPSYKKAVIEEIVDNIYSNTSQYYAFAANPVAYPGSVPAIANTDYETSFINNWQMMFGKKIKAGDVSPVIAKNMWQSNTVYVRYDNTSNTVLFGNNFYVVSPQSFIGGNYYVYKCIDNANGNPSTVDPGSIGTPNQPSTFQTADGYKWRYMYSITEYNFERFASANYVPVSTDAYISSTAYVYSGVELVVITNPGSGYRAYTNGTIRAVLNSTAIQIENESAASANFYRNSGIYIYNTTEATSQLKIISSYVANSLGKFVLFAPTDRLTTNTITTGTTKYLISPAVIFKSDGDSKPRAYTTVNTSNFSIESVVMLEKGTNISWANVSIQSNYGTGANMYAIVPPPGGHGSDPASELNVKGLAIAFNFANSENLTIPTSNVLYNKVGIFKNPFALVANGRFGTANKGSKFTANSFNQLLIANVTSSATFTPGDFVTGVRSGARGTVVFSNTTQVYLTGDKNFINNERIANSSGVSVANISIQRVGDLYTKDLKPIYVENINNVNRSNTQTEVYKLTIEI